MHIFYNLNVNIIMFIKEFIEKTRYERVSKHGKKHTYYRNKTVVLLRCDNCDKIFNRLRGAMDPNRINNNVFHVCDTCDSKKFAQKMGITRKKIWDMPASSNLDISKL